MALRSDGSTYGLVARALHWSIAVLIVMMLASGYLSDALPKGTIALHKATGILVLGLTALRLVWWAADRDRPDDSALSWEKWPARVARWLLLLFCLAIPLSGWLMSSAAGRPITVYGLFGVPLLTDPDQAMAGVFLETHETLASVLVAVLALHVAGALRHQLALRDGVLARMWPSLDRSRTGR